MAKILIVDDQIYVRQLLAAQLMLKGHHVNGVRDATSAKEYLHTFQPDLVLLDLFLDGPQGFDLLEHFKRQKPRLPVLMVTAHDTFRNDARLAQADGYVVKDFDLKGLMDTVQQVLSGPAREDRQRKEQSGGRQPSQQA